MAFHDSRASLGPRASMGPRPSLGPRASIGARGQQPAAPVQAFSFPILKTADILQCMHELQVRLSEAEINEADKHREAIRRAYEQLVEICTGTTKEEMAQPAFQGLAALNFPELHEESIPELNFFRACHKMMTVCGVHDFSMKDLLAPEPKRVRRHLSAVINFAKFREERLVMYAELAVKRDALLDTLRRLQEEEAEMGKELAGLQAQTAAEAEEVARLEAACAAAEAELEALNREQAAIRAEGGELKKRSQELKDGVAATGAAVEAAKEERERVRGQIVRSPARVRKELATAAEDVETEKEEGLAAEKDAREMAQRVAAAQRAEKEVGKALKSIEEVEVELAKQKAATKELKDATKAVQANRQKASESAVEAENLRRQAQRFEERLAHLRRSAKAKDEAIEAAAAEAHAELLAAEKAKRAQQGAVDDGEAEVARVTATLEGERAAHAAQRGEMTAALKVLGETVAEHQRGLRAALADATNALAPLPVAGPGAGGEAGGKAGAGTGATPILSRLSMAGGRLSSIAKSRLSAAVAVGASGGLAVPAAVEEGKPVV